MTVLWKAFESGCYMDKRSGSWMVMARVDGKQRENTQIRLKHDLNQQQDLDLGQKLNTTNSETELCKGYGVDGFR